MAGIDAVCSESSSPRPNPKITTFRLSSLKSVRVRMPSAGGSTSLARSMKWVSACSL